MNVSSAQNPLGYEKISTLLRRFAVPSVVAMLVSSLYNIVDQIYIGTVSGISAMRLQTSRSRSLR